MSKEHQISPDVSSRHAVLIDVHPLIFRSFYANPTMTRADGAHVNAVYGYTRYAVITLEY